MANASRSASQEYALPNDWQLAHERLSLLAACHDPATFRRARALGIEGEVVDAGRAVLVDPDRWFYGPAKIVTWGRRPGAVRPVR